MLRRGARNFQKNFRAIQSRVHLGLSTTNSRRKSYGHVRDAELPKTYLVHVAYQIRLERT